MINEIVFFDIPCVGECRIRTNKGYTSYPVQFTIVQRVTEDDGISTYTVRLLNGIERTAFYDTDTLTFYYYD